MSGTSSKGGCPKGQFIRDGHKVTRKIKGDRILLYRRVAQCVKRPSRLGGRRTRRRTSTKK